MAIKTVVVNGKAWDKESLRELLQTNDVAVLKGMVRIFDYQTSHEKAAEGTIDNNSVGFSGVDGHIMSSFARQYQQRGSLSPKQMVIARKKMTKYVGQLLKIMSGQQ